MSSKVFRAAGFLTWRWGHKIWSPSSFSILNDMRHVSSSVAGDEQDSRSSREQQNFRNAAIAAVGTACLLGGTFFWKLKKDKVKASEDVEAGNIRPGLPTYTLDDVARHKTKETGIWVTFKNGVYDITEYVSSHPGGSKILLAAGGSVEPFWDLYAVHKHSDILSTVESFRIGNITELPKVESFSKEDPYANDPPRSPLLIPSSKKPFNAEPPAELLVDNYLTPNDLFFVRNHLPVPNINPRSFTLEVQGPKKELKLSINDLKKQFKKKSVVSVVQCAGNRRSEMSTSKPVKGLNWGSAAIGNAEWSGVALNDILAQSEINLEKTDKKHLVFEGLDRGPDGSFYGASLPIELAILLKDEIIVAYEMNGKELPRDHGYPLRVIIPGVVGARQVKWLNKIYLSDEESESHWQRRDYKGFNCSVDWHNVDFDSSVAIMQLPVISAICDPPAGAELEEGAEDVTVRGYAWSGGGRAIIRVDVSADGGKTWHVASIQPNGQSQYKAWGWSLWEATIPLPPDHKGEVELVCKAVDVAYNAQPDRVEGIWNLRGVLSNAWHHVKVIVPPSS
ncbi:LOW QUALITY PROTEIN: sulfite oxidase-like [Pomacea canaliculata]|uniref:LOW QUALITY PROTEIN: sulfite oxidase-like n=1 Tax=Pomacea canaliculata TaxID=400727 RepID=UPI000D732170|nr:LOW QUALITY PROTEIN: sulfite oxidase-like [Pomacea canaliculata]